MNVIVINTKDKILSVMTIPVNPRAMAVSTSKEGREYPWRNVEVKVKESYTLILFMLTDLTVYHETKWSQFKTKKETWL